MRMFRKARETHAPPSGLIPTLAGPANGSGSMSRVTWFHPSGAGLAAVLGPGGHAASAAPWLRMSASPQAHALATMGRENA